jgi:hypothetical protein
MTSRNIRLGNAANPRPLGLILDAKGLLLWLIRHGDEIGVLFRSCLLSPVC